MLRTLPCHCCSPPRGTTHHRLLRLQPLYPSRPCRYIAPPQCSGRDSENPGSQRPTPRQPDTTHVQFPEAVAARWRQLDPPQRVYAVAVALLLILAVPRAITLAVLLAERVLVGGLLVTEELLLGLLLKSAALVCAPYSLAWHHAPRDTALYLVYNPLS